MPKIWLSDNEFNYFRKSLCEKALFLFINITLFLRAMYCGSVEI